MTDYDLPAVNPNEQQAKEEFGRKLRYARKKAAMLQEEVAAHLGVTVKSIQNWEQGRRWPDVHTLAKLALVLDVSPSFLIFDWLPFRHLKKEEETLTWYFLLDWVETVAKDPRLPEDLKAGCRYFNRQVIQLFDKLGGDYLMYEPANLSAVLNMALETCAPILLIADVDARQLGTKIRTLREYYGLEISDVARRMGVKDSVLADLEAGQIDEARWKLSNDQLQQLASLLGVSLKDLFDPGVKLIKPLSQKDADVVDLATAKKKTGA